MDKNIIIRNEKEQEYREVENLVRESFWNVYRPGCTEHYVLKKLRDDKDFVEELDFVMEKVDLLWHLREEYDTMDVRKLTFSCARN